MVDDLKSMRDGVFKAIFSALNNADERDGNTRFDLRGARDLIGGLANWAGKGKDEVVQMLCREVGSAVGAVLKETLTQILKGQKLQLTVELSPKTGGAGGERVVFSRKIDMDEAVAHRAKASSKRRKSAKVSRQ